MGKMMSILEKYKLVEKDEKPSTPTASNQDDLTPMTSSENITPSPTVAEEQVPDAIEPSIESAQEEKIMSDYNKTPNTTSSETTQSPSVYDHAYSIEDVYVHCNLGDTAPTETVFLLENLIHALPSELPEFVKKTTLDNIAKASAIDVNKLLADGETRNTHLNHFINEFTTANLNDIANLKKEIEYLSARIADYHQQIKYRELLIQEETTLVMSESNRIHNILEFFKK